jgi:hypothetical protein
VRFPYVALPTRRPVYPLGGALVRHRPLVAIQVGGPSGTRSLTATVDSGSDDTILPAYLAPRLGIDLARAPAGEAGTVGGSAVAYQYAMARLRLSDGYEECEWDAIVGFVATPMRWAIIGYAGALQYFNLQLLGLQREALIVPNASFPGRHVTHRSTPP